MNSATNRGGGVLVGAEGVVESCTIAQNAATNVGGGVSCEVGATVRNTIIYFNRAWGFGNWSSGPTGVRYEFCATTPGVAGPGNRTDNPQFMDVGGEDYRLQARSACVDVGTNQEWMASAVDLAGRARIVNGTVDIGAFEYRAEGCLGDAVQTGDGWKWLEWFGYFKDMGGAWVYHAEYGWMYTICTSPESIWFWTAEHGWIWTSDIRFPQVLRISDGQWIRLGGGLWGNAEDLGNGWKRTAWFGTFQLSGSNWLWHEAHGWMYYDGTTTASIWFWTADLEWLWTGDATYPYLWRARDTSWLWYSRGTTNPRWFKNLKTDRWEQWNP
jgi:hypothetical protein